MTTDDEALTVEVPLAVLAAVWGGAVGAVAAMDVYANRRADGSTLSMFVRRAFKTHTREGRATFLAAWLALTVSFCRHICQGTREYR